MLPGNGMSQSGDFVTLVGIHFGNLNGGGAVFSGWGRVITDLTASVMATRIPTLSAPVLQGGTVFTFPQFSWQAVSGATRYNIYRVTNGVVANLGTTTNTWSADGSSNVLEYTGSSEPVGPGVKIEYYVYAVSNSETSVRSASIWYRGASGSFSVYIDGPSVVGPSNAHCSTWTAQVTGADVVVSYDWSGLFTSNDTGVQGTVGPAGGDLQLLVVDSQNRQGGYIK